MTIRHYGLIGAEIARSPSAAMHNAAFSALGLAADYSLRPTPAAALNEVFRELGAGRWAGLNVTSPLKTLVVDHVRADETAARAQAVNTLVNDAGLWRGFLTDIHGVLEPLARQRISAGAGLILGAGGAARAAAIAFERLGLTVHVAARDPRRAQAVFEQVRPRLSGQAFACADREKLAQLFGSLEVVVNATPVGTAGDGWDLPWDKAEKKLVAFDMVYTPRRTLFLQAAQACGLRIVEGWEMLVSQGAQSFSLWTGRRAPLEVMTEAVLQAIRA
jgi:shikimate dehydrogenase